MRQCIGATMNDNSFLGLDGYHCVNIKRKTKQKQKKNELRAKSMLLSHYSVILYVIDIASLYLK